MKSRSPEVQICKDKSLKDSLKEKRPEDRQTYSAKVNKEEVKFRSPPVSLMDLKQKPESQKNFEVKF